jgi:hypothetical protein
MLTSNVADFPDMTMCPLAIAGRSSDRAVRQVLVPFGAGEVAAGEVAGHGLPVGRVEVEDGRRAV